jgi:hypothetical protein
MDQRIMIQVKMAFVKANKTAALPMSFALLANG